MFIISRCTCGNLFFINSNAFVTILPKQGVKVMQNNHIKDLSEKLILYFYFHKLLQKWKYHNFFFLLLSFKYVNLYFLKNTSSFIRSMEKWKIRNLFFNSARKIWLVTKLIKLYWAQSFFLIPLFFKIIKVDSHSVVGKFDTIFINCFTTLLHYNYSITLLKQTWYESIYIHHIEVSAIIAFSIK